jgi:hypothetical protein
MEFFKKLLPKRKIIIFFPIKKLMNGTTAKEENNFEQKTRI